MAAALVYIDSSSVREGALDELKSAIRELAEFVEANAPQLISYGAYISDDGTEMTVMHMHPDPGSLDRYLEVAGPRFGRFKDLVTLTSIHIYGEPSERALGQLQDKARLLGSGDLIVQRLHAGFTRLEAG